MCHYRTLYYDDKHGYVVLCEHCRYFQLGFGCVLINFELEEFNSFRKMVAEIAEDYHDIHTKTSKSITIPTPCQGLSLFVSPAEIHTLHNMIEEADTSLQVKELLNLF